MFPFSRTLALSVALLGVATAARAQCSFTPTVTPNNLILCPQAVDTLRTQTFDSYQWYKDGQPIAGATQPFLPVEQFADAGSMFKVAGTLNGCTAQSAEVLVDGWAFAGITVMSSGPYATDPIDGHFIICDSTALHPRDSVVFEVMQPYVTNNSWTRDGQPVGNLAQFTAFETGTYEVAGSPRVCASYVQHSLPLYVELRRPSKPTIALVGGQLVATPAPGVTLSRYEWFLNGVQIPGATTQAIAPVGPGSYRVQGDDGFCWAVSDVFHYTPTGLAAGRDARVTLAPNPVTTELRVEAPAQATVVIRSLTGREVLRGAANAPLTVAPLAAGLYFVQVLDARGELLHVGKLVKE